ncbi:MAG: glycosyltransferase family 4 protein [Anaerohalosphaeraceae bacterium]
MRIVQITPGSGDQFYCENCLRDTALVRALRRLGADVVLVPMYLPLSLDGDTSLERTELFFGGINVYLQHKLGPLGRLPGPLRRWLDSEPLLRRISRRAGMTSARQLGEMTLSMLDGPQGRQSAELNRLTDFLASLDRRPDVIILSNLLLAGLAGPLRQRLGCRLMCWLQDEDGFIDGLGEPWTARVWQRLRELLEHFELFLPVSRYYAEVMKSRLGLSEEKLFVCPPGLELGDYAPAQTPPAQPSIGFLARMAYVNGLDIAAEAFALLASKPGLEPLRLLICGGKNAADEPTIRSVQETLAQAGLAERVRFVERFEKAERLAFLQQIHVLVCPARYSPAYAMNVLEAMACGVPFAAPRAGVYPEWAQQTGGGILYEPNSPQTLAETLEPLLRNPQQATQMGAAARQAVLSRFDMEQNARRFLQRLETKTGS